MNVYKKGAEAVLDYISTNKAQNTMSKKSVKMAKIEEPTIQALNVQGEAVRIKIEPIGTSVLSHTSRQVAHR